MPDLSLTYDELADRLGITRNAARVLAQRRRWPRTQGNDGRARVRVPSDALDDAAAARAPHDQEQESTEHAGELAALRAHLADRNAEIARLAIDLDRARAETDRERDERRQERDRSADLGRQLHAEQSARLAAEMDRKGVEAERDRLRARVEELEARARRPWWRRAFS